MEQNYFYGIGRRKTAVATVRLYSSKGTSLFNNKKLDAVYPDKELLKIINEPFVACNLDPDSFHFTVVAKGGGFNSQLEAARLGIARALVKLNPEFKKLLKKEKLTTRDPRMVESKKTGYKKARKTEQYSKR